MTTCWCRGQSVQHVVKPICSTLLQIQERVQKELDEHVGSERTVRVADRGQLPYLDSVINEGMRIRPVSPVLIPHTALTASR